MTQATGTFWGVGLRRAVVYLLGTDGFPAASSTTVYEGIEVEGPRAFDLTVPQSRRITNSGNDRVRDSIFLPPTDPVTGELRVGYAQHALIAAAAGLSSLDIGDVTLTPLMTDLQGSEVDVALLLQQYGHNENGVAAWRTIIIPKARLVFSPASFNENALEVKYDVSVSPTGTHLWGVAASGGITEFALLEAMSENRLNVVAWKGNGSAVDFDFPAAKQAVSAGKINVFNATDGVEVTGGDITKQTDDVTFGVAPTSGDIIVSLYEYTPS